MSISKGEGQNELVEGEMKITRRREDSYGITLDFHVRILRVMIFTNYVFFFARNIIVPLPYHLVQLH